MKYRLKERLVSLHRRISRGLLNFFVRYEGGKLKIREKQLFIGVISLSMVIFGLLLISGEKDTSFVESSSGKIIKESKGIYKKETLPVPELAGIYKTHRGALPKEGKKVKVHDPVLKLKYRATQVLIRKDHRLSGIPSGGNLIGKLLTTIDTRNLNQIVKVTLPYGGSFKNEKILNRNTILMGKTHYSGRGKRVFIEFNQGIHSDGRAFKVHAQALSPSDYSLGLSGEHHSSSSMRFLAGVGLKMLSVGSEVLVQKESLSEWQTPIAKATMRNAMLQGLSEGANIEAQRQVREIESKKGYVTIDAGEDVIISLISSLSKNEIK